MSVSTHNRRFAVRGCIVAALAAFLLATLSFVLLPQQAYAAVGDTFVEQITIGDEQVDCTFKINGSGTVAIGEGEFSAAISSNTYAVDSAKPALPMVSIGNSPEPDYITSYVADARGALVIPSTITHEGTTYRITEISSGAFFRATGITSVTIPSSVTTLGAGAFCRCNGITTVNIPNTITEIPDYCFASCSGLREITGAANVTSIGASAYRGCTAFHELEIPAKVTTIGDYAFCYCSGVSTISMSNNITSIGTWAFAYCPALESITLSENLESLSDYMFFQDYHLSSVEGTSGLTSLAPRCFAYCSALKTFEIPSGVTSIPEETFGASGLTSITIPDTSNGEPFVIGDFAFNGCSHLAEVNFPTTGTCILGYSCFQSCLALESIDLSQVSGFVDDPYLTGYCFSGCTGLRSVTIGDRITEIPSGCFYNCTALPTVEIPSNITRLGKYAFYGCSALNSMTLPDSVETIGYDAFSGCYGLVALTLEGSSMKALDSTWYTDYAYGFTDGFSRIYVPDSLVSAYKADENWANLADYILPMSSKPSSTKVYALLKKDGTLVECNSSGAPISGGHSYVVSDSASDDYAKQAITDIKFESGVTEVPTGAFAYCKALQKVTLPSTVKTLGETSFYYCYALESVTGGSGVTDVYLQAFYDCRALKSVPFMSNVEAVGGYAFEGCDLLKSIDLSGIIRTIDYDSYDPESFYPGIERGTFRYCDNLTQVRLPITGGASFRIGDEAFRDCSSLESIILPDGIRIGANAFDSSGLTSIVFPSDVGYVDANAFKGCRQLTEVDVPAVSFNYGKTGVQQGMFSNCTALREVTLADDVDTIFGNAFEGCSALRGIDLPDSLYTLESFAFNGCSALLSIDLPDGLYELGASFTGCTALAEVTIPASIGYNYGHDSSSYRGGSFSGCTALASVQFEEGYSYSELGGLMFEGCTALGSVEIPDAVLSVGASTFANCAVLKDVHLPVSLVYLGSGCFSICPSLRSIVVPDSGQLYVETYPSGGQFEGCYNLAEITLPSGLDAISPGMFFYCVSLTQITIPKSVETIGFRAFGKCSNLETVIFENNCATTEFALEYETNPYWPDETYPYDPEYFIFGECDNLSTVVFRDKKPLPDTITFSTNPTFYYTLHYYPTQELAETNSNELGTLTIKEGTNGLASSAPAAADIFDGEWMEASVAEEAIGANAISDSGWALPAMWKGVIFTTYPEGGETLDGSFLLTSEAEIRQVQSGSASELVGPIQYSWYECDKNGNMLSASPVGTSANLELSGLSAGRHYYCCTAVVPDSIASILGLNRSLDITPVVCVNYKTERIASNPTSIRYRWPVSKSNSGYGPSFELSNPSSATVTNLNWSSKNGYFSLDANSFNHVAIDDMDPGQTYSYTVYPRVPGAEPGTYEDTLIITSENAATLEIPVTLIFYDDSVPYANFSYTSTAGVRTYDTYLDFGTIDANYTNPHDNYGNQCTVYAEGGAVKFSKRTNPQYFDIYNEMAPSGDFTTQVIDDYDFSFFYQSTPLSAGDGRGLEIAPKAGLAPGIYEETLSYYYTAEGVTNGRMDITLRVKVGNPGGINVSPASCTWDRVREGYGDQDPMTVTITNNEETAITLPSNTGSALSYFTVDGAADLSIPAGASRTFTVVPKTGLEPGTYNETLTIAPAGLAAKSISLSFTVDAIEPVTATVDFTSQMGGGFLHSPQLEVEVSSDLAESYGYDDGVFFGDDVSALDVLVRAHELALGSDFTPATATDYLAIGDNGYMTTFFGIDSDICSGGFFLNRAMANDGTESSYGGYNGTTVDITPVADGDLLEFFFYEDENWLDTYNWFVGANGNPSREFSTTTIGQLDLTLMGCSAMSGYLYKDAEEMMASDEASAQSDVQIYLVDIETSELTAIDGAITDEDGAVTLAFDEPGTYTIAAYGTDDAECKQIMSLTTVTVTAPKPGWNKIGDDWYYFDDNGNMVTSAWKKDSKGWCYLGEDGKMVTNDFVPDSHGDCYIGASGYMITDTKWLKVDGEWYHVTKGYKDTNTWMKDGTKWCYLGDDGTMVKSSWRKDSKGWCYLGSDGYMVTNGFVPDSHGMCYIGSSGYMDTGTKWVKVGSDWYHITKGYMDVTHWYKDSKGWCYVGADGKMVTNGFAPDSKGLCYIGSSGYMDTSTKWVKVNGYWYHITKGYMDTSKWYKDSKGWCYVGASGRMVTDGFAPDSHGECWIGPEGYMLEETRLVEFEGDTYYIVEGYMQTDCTVEIDGETYTFGADGKRIL